MNRGDKFNVSLSLDVEILGYYPAGEQQDGKAKYVCTINGYKMTTGADFLEAIKNTPQKEEKIEKVEEKKEEKKEVKKSGRKRKSNA